jgi:2'-5' RNA ligase
MSKPRNNLRMFVAVYPPIELVREMVGWLKRLDLPPYRLTPAEQVHLTMQFIGDVPVAELEATIESVRCAAAGLETTRLEPERLISLPKRGPKRLVALRTDAPPTILEMQRRLAQRLARNVRRRPGDQFLPHLTLCRFRSPTSAGRVDEPVALDAFDVAEVILMKSTLHPDGARHQEVERVKLEKRRT